RVPNAAAAPAPAVVRREAPPAAAPAAKPAARVAPVKAATTGTRPDRPVLTIAVAFGIAFVLSTLMAWSLTLVVLSLVAVPTLAGWLGGRLTPGDRLVRTGYAAGGAALGVILAAVIYGLLLAPQVAALLGDPAPPRIDLVPYLLTATFIYGIPGALFSAAAAYWLAEPAKPKA
ncbi:MAG TPA: hypothetical protein VNZ52_04020, partial [Candidatus Thermoplasmatota archaeon]|nr:hypothetical protein [Candidatus Thermoplasmatota archaeon]